MADPTIKLDFTGDLHKTVLEALNKRFTMSANKMRDMHDKWRKNEDSFLAYLPEKAVDAKKRVDLENSGVQDYQTIILPYSYAMVMSAHSYWTSVFLARNPIYQFSGRHGESEQQVQAIEALIDYQIQVGGQIMPLYFWLLDAAKFGIGYVGEYWCEEVNYISRNVQTTEQPSVLGIPLPFSQAKTKNSLQTETVRGYYGTKTFNIRPYDAFPDPRVPLHAIQRGEFFGYLSEVSWNEVLRKAQAGEFVEKNAKYLKARKAGQGSVRTQGSSQVELPNQGTMDSIGSDITDTGPYNIVTMYVELIGSEWGLSDSNYPEKWVFWANCSGTPGGNSESKQTLDLILGARPCGCYHNKFPFSVIEMEPEAYALISRGMPEICRPIQRAMDWLLNSHMYNVRNALNIQFLIDPTKVVMSDFKTPIPGGGLRLRPAAYGTPLNQVMQQLQVQDVTSQHIPNMEYLDSWSQKALGVNEQIMGMVNSGGRKTAQEIRSSSSFGVNRQKTNAEFFSTMGFQPLGDLLVRESQQWYDTPMKLRIVGDLAQMAGPQFFDVTPELIAGAFDVTPVDGTLPIDRFAQANLWKEIMVATQQMPQIAMQYDLAKIFAWTAQLAGLKNINQFKIKVMPDAQVQGMAQAGNVVPLPTKTNLNEPGQIAGVGPTG